MAGDGWDGFEGPSNPNQFRILCRTEAQWWHVPGMARAIILAQMCPQPGSFPCCCSRGPPGRGNGAVWELCGVGSGALQAQNKAVPGTEAVRAAALQQSGRGCQVTPSRELLSSQKARISVLSSQKARISHLAVSAHTGALVSPEVRSACGQNVHFCPDHTSQQLKAADVPVLVQTPIGVWI